MFKKKKKFKKRVGKVGTCKPKAAMAPNFDGKCAVGAQIDQLLSDWHCEIFDVIKTDANVVLIAPVLVVVAHQRRHYDTLGMPKEIVLTEYKMGQRSWQPANLSTTFTKRKHSIPYSRSRRKLSSKLSSRRLKHINKQTKKQKKKKKTKQKKQNKNKKNLKLKETSYLNNTDSARYKGGEFIFLIVEIFPIVRPAHAVPGKLAVY